jgi:hypothetical protein
MYIVPDDDIALITRGLPNSVRDKLEKMARDLVTLEKRLDRQDVALAEAAAVVAKNFAELSAINAKHEAVYKKWARKP